MTDLFQAAKLIPIDHVLTQRYGIAVPEGSEPRIRCPLHQGDHVNFVVYRTTNTWFCFSECHMGGDVTRLVALLEQVRPSEAARLLCDAFRNGSLPAPSAPLTEPEPAVLKPITWSLELDHAHPSLASFGITPELVETFGIGFCRRGRFANRLCFPVEDPNGKKIGYIGRTTTGAEPKYIVSRGLARGRLLYNLHRVHGPQVVLVEGPRDTWALHRLGIACVALIGSWLTQTQVELLQRFQRILVAFDGDPAGRQGAARAAEQLAPHVWVRVLSLPDGEDPASLESMHVKALIQQAGVAR